MLKPHEERVVNEKKELDEKLSKLKEFFNTDLFKSLNIEDQNLLRDQSTAMAEYSKILDKRIKRF